MDEDLDLINYYGWDTEFDEYDISDADVSEGSSLRKMIDEAE